MNLAVESTVKCQKTNGSLVLNLLWFETIKRRVIPLVNRSSGVESLDCPICGEYGKTYASKPLGAVKIRYRKCDGCSHKYRTFEEIDSNPVVRGHAAIQRVPVGDPAHITCPDCESAKVRHDRKTQNGDCITHFYSCKGCKAKFGVEADSSDPISAARKEAQKKSRIVCPKCAGQTQQITNTKTKAGATLRRKCQECDHRFTYRTYNDGRPPFPALILAGEIEHPVTS